MLFFSCSFEAQIKLNKMGSCSDEQLVCSGLVGLAIDYTIKHGPLANGYLLTLASKMCPHKMAGQLESYMVGEPMPMANIHSVFR